MYNRRYLRYKVFHALYAYSMEESPIQRIFEKSMIESVRNTYQLYIFFLNLLNEIHDFASREWTDLQQSPYVNEQRLKLLNDIRNNAVLQQLQKNEFIREFVKNNPVQFTDKNETCRKFLAELRSEENISDIYIKDEWDTLSDKQRVLILLEYAMIDSPIIQSVLDTLFPAMEDDEDLVLSALHKTIETLEKSRSIIETFHKDEEMDIDFMNSLFRTVIKENDALQHIIAEKTKNWESDRLALCDMLLMKMAVCEWMYFPSIPVKVTLNEYIELAKRYSTPNSQSFINGVLDRIQFDLKKQNKLNKTGRGLIE